jgi:hypothetical protein
MVILYIILGIIFIFGWVMMHEISHIVGAKAVGDVEEWRVKPYPHMSDGDLLIAGAYWKWGGEPSGNLGWIYLAPRIVNILSFIGIGLAYMVSGPLQVILLIFSFFGLVDLFYGSLGIRERSDLRRASWYFGIDAWVMRIIGILLSIIGLGLGILSIMV